jgi:condensin complex subunit 2
MSSTFDDDDAGAFVDDGADFDDDDDGAGAPYDGMDEPAAEGAVDAFSSAPTVPGAEEPLDFPLEMMAQDGGDGMRRDFRDSIFGANWAGPGGSWKHSKDKADGSKDKKAPKEKFVLDFSVKVPGSVLECAKSPTAFTLSAAALENNTEESTTMPEDLHYQLKDLCTLFTKPSVRVAQGQSAGGGGVGSAAGGDGWYDYGNENDMENFCPDLDAGGMDDDDDCVGGMGLEDSTADESGMIGAPQLVGDTKINYARAAKKVDVHLLKESIWDTIEDKHQPLSDATNKSKGDASTVQGFQTVIGGINEHVPDNKKDMLKDVSVPFCFICLLHLANEKNLVLTDDKLGMLSRLDIGPDGSEGEGTGSCDWATASKNFDKIAGKSGAVRAS